VDPKERHLYWHEQTVKVEDRWQENGYRSCALWFTGLSASGKSTLANAICKQLLERGVKSYLLDGDNIRHGLNKDLGFSTEDRKENIRRIGEVAKLFVDAGLIVMTAFISPYRQDRDNVRKLFNGDKFIEIFLKCSLPECERRDPKGIYKKVRTGEVKNFTGISAPYEEPVNPELVIDTENYDIAASVRGVIEYLQRQNIVL
jgi:adenylylsulfate kinase